MCETILLNYQAFFYFFEKKQQQIIGGALGVNWSVKSQTDKVVPGNDLRNKCGHSLPFDASEIKSGR